MGFYIYIYMIKKWDLFLEGSTDSIKIEVIQEVLYISLLIYDEYIKGGQFEIIYNKVLDIFDKNNTSIDTFYDISMDETNKLIQSYYKICKSNNNIYEDFLEVYNIIREKTFFSSLPEIYQIEDTILSFIEENNFQFFLSLEEINKKNTYKLRFSSKDRINYSIDDYINIVNKSKILVNKFKFINCPNTYISKISYDYINNYNYSYITINIILK